MMDEMRIQSEFIRKIIADKVSEAIVKQLGYHVDISMGALYVNHDENGETKVSVNAVVKMPSAELHEIIKEKVL